MTQRCRAAYAVHLLTATGAGLAMLAMFAAAAQAWDIMFFWLLLALIVDGIDGPLARKTDTKANASRIDGVLLDLIIDFLTYVFVPIFALVHSGLISGWTGWISALVVVSVSALYFSHSHMKTADASFEGFPGCWNMIVLVFFAVTPPVWLMLTILVVLTPAMFLPLRFIHPVRTKRWRVINLPMIIFWIAFAGLTMFDIWDNYSQIGLILTSIYLLCAGFIQQAFPQRTKT